MNPQDKKARVSIVMGSQSDLSVMEPAADILANFGIWHEIDIVSAHRTPQRLYEYAENLVERNIDVVIAGAGGAAHLPGMIAAITVVPVIGVPVAATKMDGIDSLLSIVQMPSGVPVATVAIDNAKNAGILAAQIAAVGDAQLRERLLEQKQEMTATVATMSRDAQRVFDPDSKT